MQVAPLRRIISLVIVKSAAAERPAVLASLVTEVHRGHDDGRVGELLDVETEDIVGRLAAGLRSAPNSCCATAAGGEPSRAITNIHNNTCLGSRSCPQTINATLV